MCVILWTWNLDDFLISLFLFFFFFRFEERCKIFVLINSKSWFLYDDKCLYQKFAFPLTKIMLLKKMAINFLILSNLFALWRFFITHNIIYRWYTYLNVSTYFLHHEFVNVGHTRFENRYFTSVAFPPGPYTLDLDNIKHLKWYYLDVFLWHTNSDYQYSSIRLVLRQYYLFSCDNKRIQSSLTVFWINAVTFLDHSWINLCGTQVAAIIFLRFLNLS